MAESTPLAASPSRYRAFRVLAAALMLAYYLAPYALSGRVAPGALLSDCCWTWHPALQVLAIAVLLSAAVASLWGGTGAPPLWIPVAAYLVPVLTALLNGAGAIDREIASLACAIGTGVLAARIAGRGTPIALCAVMAGTAAHAIYAYGHRANIILSGSTIRAGGLFHDPNHLYVPLLVALPFAAVGALSSPRRTNASLYLLAGAALLGALILTWFRGAAIGLAAGAPILVLLHTRSRRSAMLALSASLLLLCVTHGVRSTGPGATNSVEGSTHSRLVQMRAGWQAFLSAPVEGVGLGRIRIPLTTRRGAQTIHRNLADPKNVLLHALAERGLAGALVLGLISWYVAAMLSRSHSDPLAIACVAGWLVLAGAGLVDTTFGDVLRYTGNCCFGLLLGVTAVVARESRADTSARLAETAPLDGIRDG